MGDPEGLARQTVEEVARDRLARRVADGVDEAVETLPALAEFGEQALDLRVVADVAVERQVGAETGGDLGDAVLEALPDVAERKFGAFAMTGLRDAVGDRAMVQHARDEQTLAGKKSHAVLRSGKASEFPTAQGLRRRGGLARFLLSVACRGIAPRL